MIAASLERVAGLLGPEDLVLDVGGWGRPLLRADWVLDLLPYETRGLYGHDGEGEQRFSEATWIRRDICAREPWPFETGQFDFVVCSHVLEDVRDPIWVCSELQRVGRAGYVEVPSRLEEQTYGFQGPWVGWGHHHWLIEARDGGLEFVFKHHILHGMLDAQFPAGFKDGLAPEERVEQLWWAGSFDARERIIVEPAELDAYLTDLVSARGAGSRETGVRRQGPAGALLGKVGSKLSRRRRRAGS